MTDAPLLSRTTTHTVDLRTGEVQVIPERQGRRPFFAANVTETALERPGEETHYTATIRGPVMRKDGAQHATQWEMLVTEHPTEHLDEVKAALLLGLDGLLGAFGRPPA
jgi:hypothetical protein